MNEGLSSEMKQEILNELSSDGARFNEQVQQLRFGNEQKLPGFNTYTALEQLTYLTEQIRLKLRLLGAPRMYQ